MPDLRAYGELIQRCGDAGFLRFGQQIHGRILSLAVVPSNFLASKLISLYARCDRIDDARKVFDRIPKPNTFAYNAMIIAYAMRGRTFDALDLFSSISKDIMPDEFTFSAIIKALASIQSSEMPRLAQGVVHGLALRLCFDFDLFVGNGLISLYAHVDDLISAKNLFDEMPERDVISWNSMISGYAHSGHYKECLQLFSVMEQGLNGVRPNAVTIVSVLQACGQLEDLVTGMRVHQYAVENRIEMDSVVWNSIISLYAKCGSLEHARGVFEAMTEKDDVSYSAMINGYLCYGFVDQAMEVFRLMKRPALSAWNAVVSGLVQNNCHSKALELVLEMQVSGARPNSVTLSSILPAVSFFSNFLVGKQVHAYAIRNDHDQNIYVASALVDVYAKTGFLQGSWRVFEMTKVRSIILWTAIISAYAAHGNADAALCLFYEMLGNGIKPDPVLFTAVLSACAHAGLVAKARGIFNNMLSEYGISPVIEHYACMVGVLSRIGKLKEAVEFIDKMPFEPNAKVWGALLNGAVVHGDTDVGKFAYEKLFDIEPDNTGNYILMANLYWKTGKWEEANIVRDKMKSIGFSKIPGCSWIETTEGLKVFVAQDVVNTQCAEAYEVLQDLFLLMREEGYVFISELDEESDSYIQLIEAK